MQKSFFFNKLINLILVDIKENDFLTGWALWRNHLLAMLIKRVLSTVRSWILLLIQNIIPVLFLIIAIIVARQMNTANDLPKLDITLDSYDDSVTVVTTENQNNLFYNQYKQLLRNEGREYIDWVTQNMSERMINQVISWNYSLWQTFNQNYLQTIVNTSRVRMRYIIGATFMDSNNSILAWFNNEPYHSPPLALQYAINTLIKAKVGSDRSISFSNFPLPYTIDTKVRTRHT